MTADNPNDEKAPAENNDHWSSYERPKPPPPSALSTAIAFILWTIFGGFILGILFAFYPYYSVYDPDYSNSQRRRQQEELQYDTVPAFKTRFWLGVGCGAAGAAWFWVVQSKKRAKDLR